jgi:acetyltransferase
VQLDALAQVVVAVGDALAALPAVAGIELNPVLASASGAVAVDWKLTL